MIPELDAIKARADAATELTDYPGYSIDRAGQVWSEGSNWRGYGTRQITPVEDMQGYLKVRLTIEGKRVNRKVHSLVASAFLPPRPSPEHQLRHLNGDKRDNRATNLAWGTAQENANDRFAHGNNPSGSRNGSAKLNESQVKEIRKRLAQGESRVTLAAEYGVHKQTISNINTRRWWRHV